MAVENHKKERLQLGFNIIPHHTPLLAIMPTVIPPTPPLRNVNNCTLLLKNYYYQWS